jgi:hypothetical protein
MAIQGEGQKSWRLTWLWMFNLVGEVQISRATTTGAGQILPSASQTFRLPREYAQWIGWMRRELKCGPRASPDDSWK